jgi:S-adenosylmethionine decarboxylase
MDAGEIWVVDAHGCAPDRLRSRRALAAVFDAAIAELGLKPVAPPTWHRFPGPGGITGFVVLSESHLSCHTFPETGFAAIDLYCCRQLADWPWSERLRELLGAECVDVRRVERGVAAHASSRHGATRTDP